MFSVVGWRRKAQISWAKRGILTQEREIEGRRRLQIIEGGGIHCMVYKDAT
jgi:hypothetical protein